MSNPRAVRIRTSRDNNDLTNTDLNVQADIDELADLIISDPDAFVITAGENLGGGRAIVLETDGLAYYLDHTKAAHAHTFIGVTTGAVSSGGVVQLARAGTRVSDSGWNFVSGPVFAINPGIVTQTPPTSGFNLIIGGAISTDEIFIKPENPVFLI